jgi:hypothetical protein
VELDGLSPEGKPSGNGSFRAYRHSDSHHQRCKLKPSAKALKTLAEILFIAPRGALRSHADGLGNRFRSLLDTESPGRGDKNGVEVRICLKCERSGVDLGRTSELREETLDSASTF